MESKSSTRQVTILQAALHCFITFGVEATTIDMIREQSGASVGSLYHHFGNKEGIAAALYKEGLRQFNLQLQIGLQNATTVDAVIRGTIQANIDWIVENQDWARFIFFHRKVLKTAGQEMAFREEQTRSNQSINELVKKLPDFHRVRHLPEPMYLSVLIGPVHEYAKRWLDGAVAIPPNELAEDFIQIAIRGLLD